MSKQHRDAIDAALRAEHKRREPHAITTRSGSPEYCLAVSRRPYRTADPARSRRQPLVAFRHVAVVSCAVVPGVLAGRSGGGRHRVKGLR